jgi:hypothetical protein
VKKDQFSKADLRRLFILIGGIAVNDWPWFFFLHRQ